ncbi:MAG: GLUG motif-containing protein, partial [Christensenella sp.]
AYNGGLIGHADNVSMHDCVVKDTEVTSDGAWVHCVNGGAVGQTVGYMNLENIAVNGGKVQIKQSVTIGVRALSGGFIGNAFQGSAIKNCSSSAVVQNDTNNIKDGLHMGGFAGNCDIGDSTFKSLEFVNCYATGDVISNNELANTAHAIGGFCGSIWSRLPGYKFVNCYTASKVTTDSTQYFGGFLGVNPLFAEQMAGSTFTGNMYVKNFTNAKQGVGDGLQTDGITALGTEPREVKTVAVGSSTALHSAAEGGFAFAGWTTNAAAATAEITNPTSATAAMLVAKAAGSITMKATFTRTGYPDIVIPYAVTITDGVIPVYTWEDFKNVQGSGKYIQMNDIVATDGTYQTKAIFSGTYDGGGYSLDLSSVKADGWGASIVNNSSHFGVFGKVSGTV